MLVVILLFFCRFFFFFFKNELNGACQKYVLVTNVLFLLLLVKGMIGRMTAEERTLRSAGSLQAVLIAFACCSCDSNNGFFPSHSFILSLSLSAAVVCFFFRFCVVVSEFKYQFWLAMTPTLKRPFPKQSTEIFEKD